MLTPAATPVAERKPLLGVGLILTRLAWLAILLLTLGVLIYAIPVSLGRLANLPLVERSIIINDWHLEVPFYIWFMIILDAMVILGFWVPAIIIFVSKSDDWMAALVSLALITFGAGITTAVGNLEATLPAWHLPVTLIRGLGISATLLVFYI